MRATVIAAIMAAGCGNAIDQEPTPPGPVCGNGIIEDNEGCDDGNDDNTDNCLSDCRLSHCGDGVTQWPEQCDDANYDNTDSCLSTCRVARCGDGLWQVGVEECDDGIETAGCDWDCTLSDCGDGRINPAAGEICDDGAANSDSQSNRCRNNCLPANCGDGVLDAGEECDHGSDNSDIHVNGCRTDCRAAYCGDGVLDEGEACDSGEGCSNNCAPDWVATEVTTGIRHACALLSTGRPLCWGGDGFGQASPPDVELVQISAGNYHTCGLAPDGKPFCWGAGAHETSETCHYTCNGDLCMRAECGQSAPPQRAFVELTAGGYHSCAIDGEGQVSCWGDSYHGATEPPSVSFTVLSANDHATCGIDSAGAVRCWGQPYPEVPAGAGPFVGISVGWGATCALDATGEATCWGAENPAGIYTQIEIIYFGDVCALDSQGSLKCWSNLPRAPLDDHIAEQRFTQVSMNWYASCGLNLDANVLCWGDDRFAVVDVPLSP